MQPMEQYIEQMETIITDQQKENKKLRKLQMIQSIVLLLLVTVIAVGVIYINLTVQTAVAGVPNLVSVATQSVTDTTQEVHQLLEEVNAVDFEQLNRTIAEAGESLDELDIDSLNQSIRSLNQIVERLALIFGMGQ